MRTGAEGRPGAQSRSRRRNRCFFNRFGQFVYKEPVGTYAGYEWPQFQIHRGDLQQILYQTYIVREAGADRVVTGTSLHPRRPGRTSKATAIFTIGGPDGPTDTVEGAAVIGCDGIHSVVRKQLHPDDGGPIYSGVNMWRGVTRWKPYLTGASYVRAGWLTHGKMVIYPIRNNIDGDGNQLINWVAEVETPDHDRQDWNKQGRLEDFIGYFADWHFDFLDVPAMIRAADSILEYPMVDKDPLDRWSFGRITLLGDAAHPDVSARLERRRAGDPRRPRPCRRAGRHTHDAEAALKVYEDKRLAATADGGAHQPHDATRRHPARGLSCAAATSPSTDRGHHRSRPNWRRSPTATRRSLATTSRSLKA